MGNPVKVSKELDIHCHPAIVHKINEIAFQGKEGEDPRLHIANFIELCTALRPINVNIEAMKLKLFHFSLKGKALDWYRDLKNDIIVTWGNCVSIFLKRFVPQKELIEARDQIFSCVQMIGETFFQAWERFSKLL